MKTKINFLIGLAMCTLCIFNFEAESTGITISGAGKISGNVCYSNSKLPLSNTTVTLYSTTDSSMIAGTITDKNGTFYFSILEPGTYYLEICQHGFENRHLSDLTITADTQKIIADEIVLKLLPMSEKKRKRILRIQ